MVEKRHPTLPMMSFQRSRGTENTPFRRHPVVGPQMQANSCDPKFVVKSDEIVWGLGQPVEVNRNLQVFAGDRV